MQRRINRLYRIIEVCGGRPIPAIKAALSVLGRCQPWLRLRSMSATSREIAAVAEVLREIGAA
jgi:hypothetical protein